jgi:hypothetical protein
VQVAAATVEGIDRAGCIAAGIERELWMSKLKGNVKDCIGSPVQQQQQQQQQQPWALTCMSMRKFHLNSHMKYTEFQVWKLFMMISDPWKSIENRPRRARLQVQVAAACAPWTGDDEGGEVVWRMKAIKCVFLYLLMMLLLW